MKWLALFSFLALSATQETELDRIQRQFKQAQNNAPTDPEFVRAVQTARQAFQDYLEARGGAFAARFLRPDLSGPFP